MTVTLDLKHADRAPVGGKAASLAALLQAGFQVPPGFVIADQSLRALAPDTPDKVTVGDAAGLRARIQSTPMPAALRAQVAQELAVLTGSTPTPYVAVRTSSNHEDGQTRSAAGQHDTILAVRGVDNVCQAIQDCWSSLWSDRAITYHQHDAGQDPPTMSVIVQRFVDADVSGVMFSEPNRTTIEACRGLGEPLVQGAVTPDQWSLADGRIGRRRTGQQAVRLDRHEDHLVTTRLTARDRDLRSLTDHQVKRLHELGQQLRDTTGADVDVEWAIVDNTIWVLQCRPVTAALPRPAEQARGVNGETVLTGQAASQGIAAGTARVVRGPRDFGTLTPGDVLVCEVTDPAWTPLFTIASAVVSETGGILSHTAIVARELGIPAVVGIDHATDLLARLPTVTVDGHAGQVRLQPRRPPRPV